MAFSIDLSKLFKKPASGDVTGTGGAERTSGTSASEALPSYKEAGGVFVSGQNGQTSEVTEKTTLKEALEGDIPDNLEFSAEDFERALKAGIASEDDTLQEAQDKIKKKGEQAEKQSDVPDTETPDVPAADTPPAEAEKQAAEGGTPVNADGQVIQQDTPSAMGVNMGGNEGSGVNLQSLDGVTDENTLRQLDSAAAQQQGEQQTNLSNVQNGTDSEITAAQDAANAAETKKTESQEGVQTTETQKAETADAIDKTEASRSTHKTAASQKENLISDLEGKVSNVKKVITTVKKVIEGLKAALAAVSWWNPGLAASLQAKLNAAEAKLAAAEKALEVTDGLLKAAQGDLSFLKEMINFDDEQIAQLEETLGMQEGQLKDFISQVKEYSDEAEKANAALDVLKSVKTGNIMQMLSSIQSYRDAIAARLEGNDNAAPADDTGAENPLNTAAAQLLNSEQGALQNSENGGQSENQTGEQPQPEPQAQPDPALSAPQPQPQVQVQQPKIKIQQPPVQ